jgi:ABC-2 type transport system ATP-binding protein
MLVNEYLAFVGKLRGLQDKKLLSAMDAVYQTCGLTTVVKRQIGKLSKGFRQRVGLAQAMIHNPDLLILDEPTAGLDPNQIVEIRELIKKLGKEKTVVYCSHILPEVSATCSKILIINEGSAVATGTAEELTSQSGKGNIYRLRIKADRESAETKLSTLPVVSKVKVESSSDGWLQVLVTAEGKIDVGEDLFKCVVQNGWSLAELRRETTSLEETFAQLTRG